MFDTLISEAKFAVIDLEMTGLDPEVDEIIEVASVPMTGLFIGSGEAFYSEIRPERNIPATTKIVHGLHGRELSEAPPIETVFCEFIESLHGRVVVAHNVAVDISFIKAKSRFVGVVPPEQPAIDTVTLAGALFPNRRNLGLDSILREFGIPERKGNHNALTDAILTANAFAIMLKKLKKAGKARTVRDLLSIGGTR